MSKFFKLLIIFLLLMSGYYAMRTYHYFFDTHIPQLNIIGIIEGNWYADTIECSINADDPYLIESVYAWIDEKPLFSHIKIKKNTFEYNFAIDSKKLANGMHKIKFCLKNALYKQTQCLKEISFNVDNEKMQVRIIHPAIEPTVLQGRTLHLKLQATKELYHVIAHSLSKSFTGMLDTKIPYTYEFLIPVDCEELPGEYNCSIEIIDKMSNSHFLDVKFKILAFPFKKQTLKIDTEKIDHQQENPLNMPDLENDLLSFLSQSPQTKLWRGTFYPPTEILRISTEYGTIRTTQEKGKYVHKAIDIVNTPKSVVWAPQDGIVIIKNKYPHSGNTIVLDHGYGIFSLFFHLDDFAENACLGKLLKQGNPLGKLGKTGYASGYHLHWEMRIGNIPVDPMQWTDPNF